MRSETEIIGKLKDFIRKHAVEKAILFGSFARGDEGCQRRSKIPHFWRFNFPHPYLNFPLYGVI